MEVPDSVVGILKEFKDVMPVELPKSCQLGSPLTIR